LTSKYAPLVFSYPWRLNIYAIYAKTRLKTRSVLAGDLNTAKTAGWIRKIKQRFTKGNMIKQDEMEASGP